jgi:hypothetical protein
MPVILTTMKNVISGSARRRMKPRQPLPDDALKIVMRGPDKKFGLPRNGILSKLEQTYRKNTEVVQPPLGKPASVRLSS